MTKPESAEPLAKWREALQFSLLVWFASRAVVLIGMLIIAPALPVPDSGEPVPSGWQVFGLWDGEHYAHIATHGYPSFRDGKINNAAFFPLFPLLMRAGMSVGLSAEAAGALINHLTFLGALVVLYVWMLERCGRQPARWATATIAWFPHSMFCSPVYTEGLFLLCSTAGLRAFDRHHYRQAAVWGALTSAIRPPGIAVALTFAILSWREKRKPTGKAAAPKAIAYLSSLIAASGMLLYMLFCWLKLGQPLAFWLAQRNWNPGQDYYGEVWVRLLSTLLFGHANYRARGLVDPWYPLSLVLVIGIAIGLWRFRHRIGTVRTGYGLCASGVLLWLIGGKPFTTAAMVLGGGYLIWRLRHRLPSAAVCYALLTWLIIFASGRTLSIDRFAFGCVTLSMALGLLLSSSPPVGRAVLVVFGLLLALFSIQFAQSLWIA